ncbi:MAG: GNAT family N-acetyltransferase [Bacteroidota bacterium]
MSTFSIRPARPEEAPRLTEIALASKQHWGYPEAWMEAWRDGLTFTPDYIAAHTVQVATEAADRPVACYVLEGITGEIQLEHVWVEPSAMGRGLGRQLVAHAVETARGLGGTTLLIDSDPNAAPFYERMGCERVGSRRADVCGEHRELPQYRYSL